MNDVIDNITHRARIVKGWAFMDLSDGEKDNIREFLKTGKLNCLIGTSFQSVILNHSFEEIKEIYCYK